MKALFYGGVISSLAGLGMGFGMHLPHNPPGPVADDQAPVYQQAALADETTPSVGYSQPADLYPPSYVIDAAYTGPLATTPEPVHDEPAAEQVLETAWTDPPTPAAAPQDVAAAGDTTPAPKADPAPVETRTYASIDALLSRPPAPPPPAPSI